MPYVDDDDAVDTLQPAHKLELALKECGVLMTLHQVKALVEALKDGRLVPPC